MLASIGQRLKKERESRYLTLEKASEETRIRVVFLQALEADDYSIMPSPVQGRGFLRNYCAYLGLNLDEMVAEIQRDAPPPEVSGPLPEVNLAETEIPIPAEEEKKPARNFLSGWLNRRHPTEDSGQADSAPAQPAAETLPDAPNSTGAEEESRASFFSIIKTIKTLLNRPAAPELHLGGEEKQQEESAPVPASREPLLPADKIFAEIGEKLRERRELISLTVEEVERHTKLRAAFLRALEAGAYDKLPSPVQTRGMLANYATFLDMDVDAILLRFADGLQARRYEKYAEIPREKIQTEVNPSIPWLRMFIAGDFLFGLLIIVVLAGLAIWGVGRVISSEESALLPTAPAIADVLGENLPTQPAQGLTFVPVNEGRTTPTFDALQVVEATPTFRQTANVVVEVYALERTFARIAVDGKVVFEGRLAPRDFKLFEANNQVVVLTGNGAALQIKYNGEDLGLMGNSGEVVSRVYLITGVATPTATLPPTPTNTPRVTATSTPAATPTFAEPSP